MAKNVFFLVHYFTRSLLIILSIKHFIMVMHGHLWDVSPTDYIPSFYLLFFIFILIRQKYNFQNFDLHVSIFKNSNFPKISIFKIIFQNFIFKFNFPKFHYQNPNFPNFQFLNLIFRNSIFKIIFPNSQIF